MLSFNKKNLSSDSCRECLKKTCSIKKEIRFYSSDTDCLSSYLRIRFRDVRAARAVRRAGSSQRRAGHVEHLPRRAEVSFCLTPHVQIRWERFYSWDSSRGWRQAGDVYRTADTQQRQREISIKGIFIFKHILHVILFLHYWVWAVWREISAHSRVPTNYFCGICMYNFLARKRGTTSDEVPGVTWTEDTTITWSVNPLSQWFLLVTPHLKIQNTQFVCNTSF